MGLQQGKVAQAMGYQPVATVAPPWTASPTGRRQPVWLWPLIGGIALFLLVTFGVGALLLDGDTPDLPKTSEPSPLSYSVGQCQQINIEAPDPAGNLSQGELGVCVTRIVVLTDGSMQFFVAWENLPGSEVEVTKTSDVGNAKMYLTDNLGNRYNHRDTGGAASVDTIISPGIIIEGWYLFPSADVRAVELVFHDDDNGVQIGPIPRSWP